MRMPSRRSGSTYREQRLARFFDATATASAISANCRCRNRRADRTRRDQRHKDDRTSGDLIGLPRFANQLASQNPRIEMSWKISASRDDGWLAAYRAVEHVHALFGQAPNELVVDVSPTAVHGQGNRGFAGLGCNPLGEIRSIDKDDVAAMALISATTSSRRTTLTVFSPSDFAIGISARPTPELALF